MFINLTTKVLNLNHVMEFKRIEDFTEADYGVEFTMTDGSKRYIFYDNIGVREKVYSNLLNILKTKDTLIEETTLLES